MLIALIFITVIYLIVITSLIYGFDKIETFYLKECTPRARFSIIVPFRNEADNLPILLGSLGHLNYPKSLYEIIFIDDASTDDSVALVQESLKDRALNYSILKNKVISKSPKKDALTLGIKNSKFEWIVTTDADCRVQAYWLDAFDGFLQRSTAQFVVAPVSIMHANSFLDKFQDLDNLSLQGTTLGGFGINMPLLCNGANLCYKKTLFNALNGFEGNEHLGSGDDMFLLQKALAHNADKVDYIKSEHAIVETRTENSLSSLISQRARWASKTRRFKSLYAKIVALIVIMMNLALLAGFVSMIFGTVAPRIWLYVFIIKSGIDFLLIFKMSRFFSKESLLLYYPIVSFLYPFFIFLISIISSFGGYKWKERSYSK